MASCCQVPAPSNEKEKTFLLIGGIMNFFLPGIGTMVTGCGFTHPTGGEFICIGIAQFFTSIVFLGICWAWIYGALMIVASTSYDGQKGGEHNPSVAMPQAPPPAHTEEKPQPY